MIRANCVAPQNWKGEIMSNKLDLNLLLIFSAVMRKRSVTLAGEELNLTQSAVSNGLRRLREHFSNPLFVKTSHGMTPTPLAERLSVPLIESLDRIRTSLQSTELFDPQTSERTFRMYMSDMGELVLMPRLMRILEQEAPGITLQMVDVSPRLAQSMMADGGIDIAIGTFASLEAGFHSQLLFTKSYVLMARRGHPELVNGLSLEAFLRARHAIYRPHAASHDDFDELVATVFRDHGARRRIVVELAHALGIIETVAGSDLVICVPRRFAERHGDTGSVDTFALPFDSSVADISQFWHTVVHDDPGHQWLRSLVFKQYRSP